MLIARDGGCTKPGCTVPAYGSQVHHAARDWADDGQTNVDDLGLACGPDNRMVGRGGWTTRVNDYHRPERLRPPAEDEPSADESIPENDEHPHEPGGPEPNAA